MGVRRERASNALRVSTVKGHPALPDKDASIEDGPAQQDQHKEAVSSQIYHGQVSSLLASVSGMGRLLRAAPWSSSGPAQLDQPRSPTSSPYLVSPREQT